MKQIDYFRHLGYHVVETGRNEQVYRTTEKYLYTVEYIYYTVDLYFLEADYFSEYHGLHTARLCTTRPTAEKALAEYDSMKRREPHRYANPRAVCETNKEVEVVYHRRTNKAGR